MTLARSCFMRIMDWILVAASSSVSGASSCEIDRQTEGVAQAHKCAIQQTKRPQNPDTKSHTTQTDHIALLIVDELLMLLWLR